MCNNSFQSGILLWRRVKSDFISHKATNFSRECFTELGYHWLLPLAPSLFLRIWDLFCCLGFAWLQFVALHFSVFMKSILFNWKCHFFMYFFMLRKYEQFCNAKWIKDDSVLSGNISLNIEEKNVGGKVVVQ